MSADGTTQMRRARAVDLSRLEVESGTAFYFIVGFLLYDRLMLLLPSPKGSLGTEDDLGWLSPTGRGRIECDSLETDFFLSFLSHSC